MDHRTIEISVHHDPELKVQVEAIEVTRTVLGLDLDFEEEAAAILDQGRIPVHMFVQQVTELWSQRNEVGSQLSFDAVQRSLSPNEHGFPPPETGLIHQVRRVAQSVAG